METLARAANRGSVPTGYEIENSLKFEPDNAEMLYTGSLTAGNRRTWTISMWVKRTELSYESAFMYSQGTYGNIRFFTDDKIIIENHNLYLITNRVFRDTSAWYHVVWVNDSTQSTASNRSKLYINGVQETSFSTETYMSQNEEGNVNSTSGTYIGRRSSEVKHFAGYIADVYKVDGQALAPTDFGEFDEDSGIWKPKAYTGGSYSTQGFHLDFSDSSDLGNDSSGENNDFLLQNITSADQATDTPTNNFCTLNVLNNKYLTITEGATKSVESTDSVWYGCTTTIGVNNGKWYSEGKAIAIGTGIFFGVTPFNGTADASIGMGSSVFPGNVADTMGYWNGGGGQVYRDNSVVATIGAFAANDIIGIALDMDNGYVYFAKNGTWLNSGNPTSGATGTGGFSLLNPTETHGFAFGLKNSTAGINLSGYKVYTPSSAASDANGYGTFEYAPPTGYYALCTKNLAEYG